MPNKMSIIYHHLSLVVHQLRPVFVRTRVLSNYSFLKTLLPVLKKTSQILAGAVPWAPVDLNQHRAVSFL